jgi:hypothetical protein
MSGSVWVRVGLFLVAALTLPGCEVIGDIFQAGMAVGILLVIAAVAFIAFLIAQVRRRV